MLVKLEGLGEPVMCIIDSIIAAVPDAEIVENIAARKNIPLSEVNTRKNRAALSSFHPFRRTLSVSLCHEQAL